MTCGAGQALPTPTAHRTFPFLADAAYVNYLGDVQEEGIRAAYGKKYERLAALKAKYDPSNFFCMNQNIKPSDAAAAAKGTGSS